MQLEAQEFKNKGMYQDYSISKASNEFAFENHNIRITAVNDNTLLSVTNEKGPKELEFSNNSTSIEGKYLGHCILGDNLIIFAVKGSLSYIYKLKINSVEGTSVDVTLLYNGQIGFSSSHPIEALGYYESEDIQKVYWVDGYNQPRVINIATDEAYPSNEIYQFDFISCIDRFPIIKVTKEYSGYGEFPAGVIQYFLTYYNKFGSETNIVCSTDLNYISYPDRGAKADEKVVCDFKLEISNFDTSFDYIRVYSVKRTSIDGPKEVNIVADLSLEGLSGNEILTVKDSNALQETIDESLLYFIGGKDIVAGTLAQKNDTLFLGDIKIEDDVNIESLKREIENSNLYQYLSFGYKKVSNPTVSGYWNFETQIKESSTNFKTFKRGEFYRFAIQFQTNKGIWLQPIYVGRDIQCNVAPIVGSDFVKVPDLKIDGSISNLLYTLVDIKKFPLSNYRIVMAETTAATRRIVAQGVLCPTVFNLSQRIDNAPYSIGSWIMRPDGGNAHYQHFDDIGSTEDSTKAVNNNKLTEESNEEDTPPENNMPLLAAAPPMLLGNSNSAAEIECYNSRFYYGPGSYIKVFVYTKDRYPKTNIDSVSFDDDSTDLSVYSIEDNVICLKVADVLSNNSSEYYVPIYISFTEEADEGTYRVGLYNGSAVVDERTEPLIQGYTIGKPARSVYGPGSYVVVYGDFSPINTDLTPPEPNDLWSVQVGAAISNRKVHSAVVFYRGASSSINVFYGHSSNSISINYSPDAPVVDERDLQPEDSEFVSLQDIKLSIEGTELTGSRPTIRMSPTSKKRVDIEFVPANATIKSYSVLETPTYLKAIVNNNYFTIEPVNVTSSKSTSFLVNPKGLPPTPDNYDLEGEIIYGNILSRSKQLYVDINNAYPDYNDPDAPYDPDDPEPPISPEDAPIIPPTRVDGTKLAENISQELQGVNFRAAPNISALKVSAENYTYLACRLTLSMPKNWHSRDPEATSLPNSYSINFVEAGEIWEDGAGSPTVITEFDNVTFTGDTHNDVIAKYNKYIVDSGYQVNLFKYPNGGWQENNDSSRDTSIRVFYIFAPIANFDTFYFIERLNNNQRYFIDRSIVTLNSPDLENNAHIVDNVEGLKLRIVGAIPITSNYTETLIETSTNGFYAGENVIQSHKFNFPNLAQNAYSLLNDFIYRDYILEEFRTSVIAIPDPTKTMIGSLVGNYKVYLWQRSGPINCQPLKDVYKPYDTTLTPIDYTTSVLKHKIFANKRFSAYTDYFTTPQELVEYGIYPPRLFSSDELTMLGVSHQQSAVNYYGNYDYLVSSYQGKNYDGYYPEIQSHDIVYNECRKNFNVARIKFKETPHAVISFKDVQGITPLLPKLVNSDTEVSRVVNYSLSDVYDIENPSNRYPWVEKDLFYNQINIKHDMPYFYLLIGELYRDIDNSIDLFGGSDDNTLQRLTWIPVCKPVSVNSNIGETEGDTYFQRWDCLKSYPYTEEDENSVVDITSFMLETHINLNGRCDVNKDNMRITLARPTNTNLFNPVYNQSNNTFRYNILDDKFDLNKFSNQITWSLTKNPTENIDTWTNITLANILSLDGKNGPINKIINSNDTLVVFQDKAVSVVNYNERMQISTEQGVPVTIANSDKVLGYTVVSDKTGCINKWSICPTSSGVYYIDDFNKALMMYNREGLNNISANGMSQWFKNNLNSEVWKPEDINRGYRLSYDSVTKDVYITNKANCLLFNEQLGTFTSFMDYNDIDFIYNNRYGNSFTFTNGNNITKGYKLFGGNYNKGFDGKDIYYSITYKVNPEPLTDKIFTNVDYIADRLSPSKGVDEPNTKVNRNPFNKFEIWNEYQSGECDLTTSYKPSFLKQKFRIWRVDVPRDKNSKNKLDRIRNPWVNIKLFTDEPSNDDKMEFHNMIVKYYK